VTFFIPFLSERVFLKELTSGDGAANGTETAAVKGGIGLIQLVKRRLGERPFTSLFAAGDDFKASAMCASTFSTAFMSISTPITALGSNPSATFISPAVSARPLVRVSDAVGTHRSGRHCGIRSDGALDRHLDIGVFRDDERRVAAQSSDSLTLPAHCSISNLPISFEPPVTYEKTPFGTPARSASSHKANAEKGVAVAGFGTIVQPAA
jgi:hypothetical protein